jgi:general secretion pathway protein D
MKPSARANAAIESPVSVTMPKQLRRQWPQLALLRLILVTASCWLTVSCNGQAFEKAGLTERAQAAALKDAEPGVVATAPAGLTYPDAGVETGDGSQQVAAGATGMGQVLTAADTVGPGGDGYVGSGEFIDSARAMAAAIGTEQVLTAADNLGPKGDEYLGSGEFIDSARAQWKRPGVGGNGEGTILNFESADVREVIQTVLGEILQVNYAIDPDIKGKITLHTSNPIPRDAIIPALESVLRSSGMALVMVKGLYRVVPEAHANGGAGAPSTRIHQQIGYQHLIVPLRYVSTKSMMTVLEAVKPDKALVVADEPRNMLLASGTQFELENILETVKIYDVDQLQGMSIGVYPVRYSEASVIAGELKELFADESSGLVAGMVRIMSIDRLNMISVITPQEEYLGRAEEWIQRLDQGTDAGGRSMYTYPVEHRRAEHLATLLGELFSESEVGHIAGSGSGPDSPSPTRAADTGQFGLAESATAASSSGSSAVKIVSDSRNNSLLILATRSDYAKVRTAIRQMDVLPLQVLIEASIMEVQLTDELSYGLQWFFNKNFGNDWVGTGELFPVSVAPSFSFTLFDDAGAIRAVLDLLAADRRLQVVSSPSLLVQDNHQAVIRVGDEVPIRTSESQSLATSGLNPLVVSEIEYRETGVLLEVTPRVNAGGLVTLEITQEVNGVNETTTSGIDSPTIFQRSITTQVALATGETLYLGGLINESESTSASGIPGLRKIPWLGALFGSESQKTARTELLVTITATAIADKNAARTVTEEMRRKMPAIFPTEPDLQPVSESSAETEVPQG